MGPNTGNRLVPLPEIAHSEGGALRGTMILGAFGLGAAIPLIAAAYASRAGFVRMRGWVLGRNVKPNLVFSPLAFARAAARSVSR